MASRNPTILEDVQGLEMKLSAALDSDGARRLGEIGAILEEIRSVCTAAVLENVPCTPVSELEDKLWAAHQKIHASFRGALSKLSAQGSKMTVERRKLGSEYMKFIKSSQRFYRGYICDLASTKYGGISELEVIAKQLDHDFTQSVSEAKEADQIVKCRVLNSCHRTLIQLGDLSRYRETELGSDPKNWAPAIGFYDLAGTLLPKSGIHHHQLAVVYMTAGDFFRAIYHIYRAISAEDPHPNADANLPKICAKIASKWESATLQDSTSTSYGSSGPCIADFLQLQFLSVKGRDFHSRLDLERRLVAQTQALISQQRSGSILLRMALTNIASVSRAETKFTMNQSEEFMQSYLYFLGQNMRFVSMLLSTLTDELRSAASQGSVNENLSPVSERVLPALRIYALWLLNNVGVTATAADEALTDVHVDLWDSLARALTLIADLFPTELLPEIEWLLEEEADTVGFRPLQSTETMAVWEVDGSPKPLRQQLDRAQEDRNKEMLHRVRALLVAGLELATNDMSPLSFDAETCVFHSRVVYNDSTSNAKLAVAASNLATSSVANASAINAGYAAIEADKRLLGDQEGDAERMVDSLVGEDFLAIDETTGQPIAPRGPGPDTNSILGYPSNRRLSLSPGSAGPFAPRRGSGSQPRSQEQSPLLRSVAVRTSAFGKPRTYSQGRHGSATASVDIERYVPGSPRFGSRPGSASEMQPLNLTPPNAASRHHRVRSTDSTRSHGNIKAPDGGHGWSVGLSDTVQRGHLSQSTSGAFGTAKNERFASPHGSPIPAGIESPLLFGAGKSMWSNLPEDNINTSSGTSRVTATPLRGSAPAWNTSTTHLPE